MLSYQFLFTFCRLGDMDLIQFGINWTQILHTLEGLTGIWLGYKANNTFGIYLRLYLCTS